jgi:hypothetical protein
VSNLHRVDAEIRRLHAELDEIRAKAKKKFYKAYAAGAALKTFPRSTLPSLFEFRSGNCSWQYFAMPIEVIDNALEA